MLYHEKVRDALLRHIETDLGPVALPRIPLSPQPFTVAEFFPTPGVTPFHDPRQHAVSLAFVVTVMGDCRPQKDALDLSWVTPQEAASIALGPGMSGRTASSCARPSPTSATPSKSADADVSADETLDRDTSSCTKRSHRAALCESCSCRTTLSYVLIGT